jgi:hypothetical protein
MSISQKHGAAGRGGHSVFRGLPYDIGAIGIGQDQAGVLWKLAGWQALGDRRKTCRNRRDNRAICPLAKPS